MALTVTEPAAGFTYQRNKLRRYEAIPFSGTWSGTTPVNIQYQLTDTGGTALTSWLDAREQVIGAGTLSFKTSQVPQRKAFYKINIRTLDSSGSVIDTQNGTNAWGVGCRVWLGGQSNIQLMSGVSKPVISTFNYQPLYARDNDGSRMTFDLGVQAVAVSNVGLGEKKICDALSNALGCVVSIVGLAVDGAALNKAYDLLLGSFIWHTPHTPLVDPGYGSRLGMAALADSGGVEFGVWQIGETEAVQANRLGTYVRGDEHKSLFKNLIKEYRRLCGRDFPVFVFPLGAATIAGMSAAQIQAHREIRDVYNQHMGDEIFCSGAGGYSLEHNGAQETTWSLDGGFIYSSDDNYAGSVVDALFYDDNVGTEKGSKVALGAEGDWFFDVGVTDKVFFYTELGNPGTTYTNPGVWPVIRQDDVYHLTKDGYEALAQQVVDAILSYHRESGAVGRTQGPSIAQVRYGNSGKTIVDLYIEHDTYGSSLVAVGGALRTELFSVLDDGAGVAISSAAIVGANLIRLTLGAAVTGIGTFAHITGSGYDGTTTNAWTGNPIAAPTEGACKDNNGRFLRPSPEYTEIETYKGMA